MHPAAVHVGGQRTGLVQELVLKDQVRRVVPLQKQAPVQQDLAVVTDGVYLVIIETECGRGM